MKIEKIQEIKIVKLELNQKEYETIVEALERAGLYYVRNQQLANHCHPYEEEQIAKFYDFLQELKK